MAKMENVEEAIVCRHSALGMRYHHSIDSIRVFMDHIRTTGGEELSRQKTGTDALSMQMSNVERRKKCPNREHIC